MRRRAATTAVLSALSLLSVAFVIGAPVARAEVGATGTRLAIGNGPARYYMTYGYAEDPELYAPVIKELARLQVYFQREGDDYRVLYRGKEIARWPIVRSREDVPETGEQGCVLEMGGNVFVPVKKLSEILPIRFDFDKHDNLVTLLPGTARPGPRVTQVEPGPADVANALASLSSVTLEQNGGRIQVRVRCSSPTAATTRVLRSPDRIVIDFEDARWASGVQAPTGAGEVTLVRIGQFTPTTARLVLSVTSPAVKLTSLDIGDDEVVASVGHGRQAVTASIPRSVQIAIAARERAARQMASRHLRPDGALDDGGPIVVNPDQGPDNGGEAPPFSIDPNIDNLPLSGSLQGKVICVDAGHGGWSTGAHGVLFLEKDLCLQMCLAFRRELQNLGATVIMPRDSDTYVSLNDRCRFANEHHADLFISIHCNSMPRPNMQTGSESYWHIGHSLRLAQALHPYLVHSFGGRDGGIRNRSFEVIREVSMPSVLLEVGYINNVHDEPILASPAFQQKLAQNLARGVLAYYGSASASVRGGRRPVSLTR